MPPVRYPRRSRYCTSNITSPLSQPDRRHRRRACFFVRRVGQGSKIADTLKLASEQRPVNVTFRTHADGVKLSVGLKSKYPDDMTIILQNDFEQLNIKDDRFEVLLRLMGNRERLSVPFNAIKAFWDKSDLKCSDG